jgi:beta-N-acetylhexosaminidase
MRLKDLKEAVGQILILGIDGTDFSGPAATLITELQPAGLILFARNITGAEQTWDLLSGARKAVRLPLFTCVDLEGGTVDRLKNILAPAPSQLDVAKTGKKKLFRRAGEMVAKEARALGFNVDFAPVTDLGYEVSRSVLGSRTISADPADTITYVREFLRGMESARVLGCGKHFPGLGEGNLDSHHGMPEIGKPWKKLWNQDLLPYRKLHKQFPFVMIAHAAYPAITKDKVPASISKYWLTDVLRKKIGYKGLILSDDLEMGGVLAAASIEDAAVQCIRAGADMFLVCHKEDGIRRSYEAVLREAERDKKFRKHVETAAARVLKLKSRSKALKKPAPRPTGKTVEKLRAEIGKLQADIAKASA